MFLKTQRSRRRDSESGAAAIVVSLLALLIFASAAIAVDLGSALVREGDTQQQADFAALAGAAELPGVKVATDESVISVAQYFNNNQTLDDRLPSSSLPAGHCRLSKTCVTPAQLVDGQDVNGEVYFTGNTRLRVLTPQTQVKFGFASIFEVFGAGPVSDQVNVASDATVMIGTGGKTLPFFVADTCSYLQQTIVDPSNGQDAPINPVLLPAGDPAYTVDLRSLSPSETAVGVNPGPVTLTAQGGQQALTDVAKIGFTTENFGTSQPSLHYEVIVSPKLTGGSSYTIPGLPPEVINTEGLWYVRVWQSTGPNATDGRWSTKSVPFVVGAPPMYCAGSQSGNFGSLNISRTDSTHATWVAMNTAKGLQRSLSIHPSGASAPVPCKNQTGSAEDTKSAQVPGPAINCLETEPGLVSQATEGFITGVGGNKGLLDATTSGNETKCDPSGGSSNRSVTISGKGTYSLNNDVLTCFITDPNVSVGDVSRKTGAPANVISSEIFSSPRFFYLPVLGNDPTGGRSGTWPIIDFRAAFVTGQPSSATSASPMATETDAASNGLITDNNGLAKLRVVLIHDDAFPDTADLPGDIIEYIGTGTKIVRLID